MTPSRGKLSLFSFWVLVSHYFWKVSCCERLPLSYNDVQMPPHEACEILSFPDLFFTWSALKSSNSSQVPTLCLCFWALALEEGSCIVMSSPVEKSKWWETEASSQQPVRNWNPPTTTQMSLEGGFSTPVKLWDDCNPSQPFDCSWWQTLNHNLTVKLCWDYWPWEILWNNKCCLNVPNMGWLVTQQ